MKSITPYQERAEKCRELAKTAKSAEDRELLLKIADSWNWIASDGEPANNNDPALTAAPTSQPLDRSNTRKAKPTDNPTK